ncbi:hypothetical protein R1sor_017949 [Riccia sorocarpa]|uniref:Complex 1 LYR protein domain-containing protein n=1 Tax=Riccia sorocarpa TaxID=122646 RepID=A0ABD3ICC7_9MARC
MATAPRVNEVRSVFRALLRVRRQAFAGDEHALAASAVQIRQEFEANRHVNDEKTVSELIAQAREAVDFIGLNVVQAKLNDRGNYEMKLAKEHAGETVEEIAPKNKRGKPAS